MHWCQDETNALIASLPFVGTAVLAVKVYGKRCWHGIKGFCLKCMRRG
jgi:hypothetical protein